MLFKKKDKAQVIEFDKEKKKAIIRCSICTGEQVAGFKDKQTGHFTEIMLIRNDGLKGLTMTRTLRIRATKSSSFTLLSRPNHIHFMFKF